MQVEISVLHNQSLLDIAIQEFGTIQTAFDIAVANGLDVTDALAPGTRLTLPSSNFEDREVAEYFKSRSIKPATALPLISEEDVEDYFGALPGMLHLMLS